MILSGRIDLALIYYQESLTVHPDLKWDIQELEAVWINLTMRSQSTLIGCLYRPPKDMTFFSSLQGLLNKIWVKRKNVVLIGDLNSNLPPATNQDQDQDLSLCGTKLQGILNILGYLNVIKSPTRITKNSTSLLDLVITSPNFNCLKSGSIDLGISDHHLVYGVFALTKSKPTPKIAFVKDYKSLDLNELKADMVRALWHIIGALEDIDDSVILWQSMFKSILDNHIKKRIVKIRDRSLPWMNTEIRKKSIIKIETSNLYCNPILWSNDALGWNTFSVTNDMSLFKRFNLWSDLDCCVLYTFI